MKKLLLPIMTLAMIMLPAAANAAQCRNTETGKFAKCGSPGSVPASQYVAKSKPKAASKTMAHTMGTPSPAPTKPGFMAMMKAKAKPATMPTSKTARCKDAKSKFVKCGTPGAKPV